MTAKRTVVIVKNDTQEVVKEFDVTGQPDRRIERLINGMSINLDWANYSIEQREA